MYFDGHSDIVWNVTQKRLRGKTGVLREALPQLQKGRTEGVVLALWADVRQGGTYAGRTVQLLAALNEELKLTPEIWLVRTASEAAAARKRGKIYAFLSIEGMCAIDGDPAGIDRYAEWGARMGMLTWNEENELATGAGGDRWSGLTPAGREVVRRMQQKGMLVDVSHLNDGGFREVLRMTQAPVLASHSNCRTLCDVPRNLTDEQLRAIRDMGGVVGVNAYHGFVHKEPALQTSAMLARHAAHMAEVMGAEHVACGFDFCEFMGDTPARGLAGWQDVPRFFEELERVGFSKKEREGIARENLLRVLE